MRGVFLGCHSAQEHGTRHRDGPAFLNPIPVAGCLPGNPISGIAYIEPFSWHICGLGEGSRGSLRMHRGCPVQLRRLGSERQCVGWRGRRGRWGAHGDPTAGYPQAQQAKKKEANFPSHVHLLLLRLVVTPVTSEHPAPCSCPYRGGGRGPSQSELCHPQRLRRA